MTNSEKALDFVQDGFVVGLGTGRAAAGFMQALAGRVQAGLRIRGIPTSQRSADLAVQFGIPLTTLADIDARIDVTIDGVDEFDRNLNLIKGLGGALVREKIVAAASRQLVILAGPDDLQRKRSDVLGRRGVLPVEVLPFGLPLCQRRLHDLGCPPVLRMAGDRPFISDNANYILDCHISPLPDPAELERKLLAIPGVVGTGFFLGMADAILVQEGDNLEILERKSS
jgi:ribose 5-phosphate isomerase A